VFENKVLRRIFGPMRDEVTGVWRNDDVKEDEMSRECSRNGEKKMHIGFCWESQKEGDH
jgi:hypothetical protein